MKLSTQNAPNLNVLTRYVQAGLALLSWCLAISATALTNNAWGGYLSSDAYAIFTGAATAIWLGYIMYAPARYPKYTNGVATVACELILNVFWFASFIASAADRGRWNCSISFRNYSHSCKVGKAYIAFAALTWLTFVFTTIFVMITLMPIVKGGMKAVLKAITQTGGTLLPGNTTETDESGVFENSGNAEAQNDSDLTPEETVRVSDDNEKEITNVNEAPLTTDVPATNEQVLLPDPVYSGDIGTLKMPDTGAYQPHVPEGSRN